jgi:Xaa-Pro dipeptidase
MVIVLIIQTYNQCMGTRLNIAPSYLPPSTDEMASRLANVRAAMVDNYLDYFVCVDPDNIFWLTNFANFVHERPFVLVISHVGIIQFVVPKLELPHVRTRAVGDIELIDYCEFPAPVGEEWSDSLSSLFKSNKRVGVEETCPHFVHNAIPGKIIASDAVDRCRYVKSDYELSRIVYASNIAIDKIDRILKEAKPGQSVIQINSNANKLTLLQLLIDQPELNALATHVGFVIQPPSISDDPHNFTNIMGLNLEEGGPNIALVNGVMNGYGTEIERTFFLGHVPEKAKHPYATMMEARHLAYELCKPGNSMHELDLAVNSHFKKAGYGENLLHRTGHSIGVTGHEGPFLAEGFHEEIQPGMLFTIEPGIYLSGVGGFRHSDTVLVTQSGNQALTPYPDSLEDMTLPIGMLASIKFERLRMPLMRLYAKLKDLPIS